MIYMILICFVVFVSYEKIKKIHWIVQVFSLCILSITMVYTVDTIVSKCGLEESGKLISTTMVDTLNGSNYFKDPTESIDENNLNILTYTSGGKEYHLTDADGELCFYPMPNEPQRIEKYKVVYKSKVLNVLFPKMRNEVYYKIYSTEI